MFKLFARLIKDQRGATAIEYGLIMALMASDISLLRPGEAA
jgi:Flp pilus assembly pilin Flp